MLASKTDIIHLQCETNCRKCEIQTKIHCLFFVWQTTNLSCQYFIQYHYNLVERQPGTMSHYTASSRKTSSKSKDSFHFNDSVDNFKFDPGQSESVISRPNGSIVTISR